MTALNFVIQENQVCLAMDTLSISANDRKPHAYVTKFIALPHLQLIVAGTGHGDILSEWFALVRSSVVATDIEHLNQYATDAISKIASNQEQNEISATVYHFGYSKNKKRFIGYAYRSTNNWVPEELKEGIGIKPAIKYNFEDDFQLPSSFVKLIIRQRELDLELPLEERIGIGGDIHFVVMNYNAINISICYRFPSYDDDFQEMCLNIEKY
jgi:hypothetical protein